MSRVGKAVYPCDAVGLGPRHWIVRGERMPQTPHLSDPMACLGPTVAHEHRSLPTLRDRADFPSCGVVASLLGHYPIASAPPCLGGNLPRSRPREILRQAPSRRIAGGPVRSMGGIPRVRKTKAESGRGPRRCASRRRTRSGRRSQPAHSQRLRCTLRLRRRHCGCAQRDGPPKNPRTPTRIFVGRPPGQTDFHCCLARQVVDYQLLGYLVRSLPP